MDRIEFVQWKELLAPYTPKWWDRPRWWLVRLLGGKCPFDTVKITRVPVNGKTFMDRLYKQRRHLFDHFNCREPQTLLIGAEDYEDLMCSQEIRDSFAFTAEYHYGRRQIMGLNVEVIPWMRGAVVMP